MQRMPSESTHVPHPPPQHQPKQQRRRRTSKLSRSLNRFVRMVFRQKPEVAAPFLFEQHHERGYEAYRRPGNLATIPEVVEKGGTDESPEIDALVRRTVSERFAGADRLTR
ncbi:hypothetical protein QJS04_geneDACA008154 [Acorus gramineus]|uniref:Uncharacterized protein n=1 Tax=Acorus gramineus TaxID=55184 RepID=A0AAV9AXM8_ACOGR|nr:hypothetical protein QJS04_geneDACA008154 [Acorus gramineus]